jgi:NhaP-type Na+/H+ or K+/H+ antiporter
VIVSLTAAGLAIDLKAGWRRWNATWRLLGIAMPLTILALVFLGQWAGLGLAGAVLLGASLAPTDPVLARSVQVGGPGKDEDPTRVALTAEAGLNDGLAFPFVWAAIALAAGTFDWGSFLAYDVVYRVGLGIAIGWGVGWLITRVVFSRLGDAANDRSAPLIVMLAATFLAYGLAEFAHAYGFLSVFIAARSGRRHDIDSEVRDRGDEAYAAEAHESADQFEGILMVILLLWFGSFVAAELWYQWRWTDLVIALALLLVVRPLAGWIAMTGYGAAPKERFKMAFFGIRGMGTIFYIAYGQTHAAFDDIDAVWRIAGLCILISVLMHESLAGWLFNRTKVAIPAGQAKPDDTYSV